MPILKSKTSQESLLKILYCNNRGIRKVKNLQKLSNEEIYCTLGTRTIKNLSNSLHATVVLTGNDTFLTKNITQDKKKIRYSVKTFDILIK